MNLDDRRRFAERALYGLIFTWPVAAWSVYLWRHLRNRQP